MYQARFKAQTFRFKTPASTSRGILHQKKSWFIILENDNLSGIGECSPIPGLSADLNTDLETIAGDLCEFINAGHHPREFDLSCYPSVRFGLETAMLDLKNGGRRIIYPSGFTAGHISIPVNGLIWMGTRDHMEKQIEEKIEAGYKCLKLKIGATDFETETDLLQNLRRAHPETEIRLDANGAFNADEALKKLDMLSRFNIHSIEQPVKPRQNKLLAEICNKSPVPVALDEELIGINDAGRRRELLEEVRPAYIVLKPGLLGGFAACEEWISIAKTTRTGWWITSALESNIGLNAIAQWTATLRTEMVQGLGTGTLYINNFPSPLHIRNTRLSYLPEINWDLSQILT
ncbi:MAG: o-succinylbenzoate synthase [Bacteroidales bacterium]|nr:o-succinylbenzoate synthase [Bacteroidales bacterium]